MITVSECAAFAGLGSNELVLGAVPSAKHRSLLESYLLNIGRGPKTVREMIVSDLRSFLDLGASSRAADILIVLRFFLSDFPQARRVANEAASVSAPAALVRAPRLARSGDFVWTGDGVVVPLSRARQTRPILRRRAAGETHDLERDATVARFRSRPSYLRYDR